MDDKCELAFETLGTIKVQRGNLSKAVNLFEKAIALVIRLECEKCKCRIQVPIKKTKHFELGGDKKRKGQMIQF